MRIRKILRNRFYLALSLVYVIFVVALCLHAPVVQQSPQPPSQWSSPSQPVVLQPGDVDNPPPAPKQASPLDGDLGLTPVPEQASVNPHANSVVTSAGIDLSAGLVPNEPSASSPGGIDISAGLVPNQPQPIHARAPLWKLGSKLSLNAPVFAAEQAELIGLLLIFALTYRFRARLMIWGAAISAFLASRRRGTCIWLGFAVVLVLALIPPWVQIDTYGRFHTQRKRLWHAPIFRAPVETTDDESSAVDYARMLTEIAIGECFVLALYLTWARTKLTVNSKG